MAESIRVWSRLFLLLVELAIHQWIELIEWKNNIILSNKRANIAAAIFVGQKGASVGFLRTHWFAFTFLDLYSAEV